MFSMGANDLEALQTNSLSVGLVKRRDDIWPRQCLCWEMGGHDRAFEPASKSNTGLNHILPRPHPGDIVSLRKLDGIKERGHIKASSRVQCTPCSHNYWILDSSHHHGHTYIVTHTPGKVRAVPLVFTQYSFIYLRWR